MNINIPQLLARGEGISVRIPLTPNAPGKTVGNFTENFTENSKHIFNLMRNNSKITIDQIANQIGISRRAVINNTNKMKELGLIRRIGPAKGGYWEVIKTDSKE